MPSIAFRKIPEREMKKIEEEEKERQRRLNESFLIFNEDGELDFKAMRKAGYTFVQAITEFARVDLYDIYIRDELEKSYEQKKYINHFSYSPETKTKEKILPIKQKAVIAIVSLLPFFLFSTRIYFANVNRIKENNTEQTNKNFIDNNTGFNSVEYQNKKYLELKIDKPIEKYFPANSKRN